MDNVKQMYISIPLVTDIYDFIKKAHDVNGDVIIKRGKFAVDAKSLLGVFSIDLSEEVIIVYPADAADFEEYITKYQVK